MAFGSMPLKVMGICTITIFSKTEPDAMYTFV